MKTLTVSDLPMYSSSATLSGADCVTAAHPLLLLQHSYLDAFSVDLVKMWHSVSCWLGASSAQISALTAVQPRQHWGSQPSTPQGAACSTHSVFRGHYQASTPHRVLKGPILTVPVLHPQGLCLRGSGVWSGVLLWEQAPSHRLQARGMQQRVQGREGLSVRRSEPAVSLQGGGAAGSGTTT